GVRGACRVVPDLHVGSLVEAVVLAFDEPIEETHELVGDAFRDDTHAVVAVGCDDPGPGGIQPRPQGPGAAAANLVVLPGGAAERRYGDLAGRGADRLGPPVRVDIGVLVSGHEDVGGGVDRRLFGLALGAPR